ncbi:hypothetical protein B0T25DRAFT_569170 [Lasiosphaeria hispida]|uniref:Uncharacterized protein n=1 Tax=Lasiosphaeria hispida TaxID=260671 RepID=A0AAJ0MEZ0_9PEZI|nr:hypothetical protein B0T25DRAFT_569170 [Lasiosphaeria hispida]
MANVTNDGGLGASGVTAPAREVGEPNKAYRQEGTADDQSAVVRSSTGSRTLRNLTVTYGANLDTNTPTKPALTNKKSANLPSLPSILKIIQANFLLCKVTSKMGFNATVGIIKAKAGSKNKVVINAEGGKVSFVTQGTASAQAQVPALTQPSTPRPAEAETNDGSLKNIEGAVRSDGIRNDDKHMEPFGPSPTLTSPTAKAKTNHGKSIEGSVNAEDTSNDDKGSELLVPSPTTTPPTAQMKGDNKNTSHTPQIQSASIAALVETAPPAPRQRKPLPSMPIGARMREEVGFFQRRMKQKDLSDSERLEAMKGAVLATWRRGKEFRFPVFGLDYNWAEEYQKIKYMFPEPPEGSARSLAVVESQLRIHQPSNEIKPTRKVDELGKAKKVFLKPRKESAAGSAVTSRQRLANAALLRPEKAVKNSDPEAMEVDVPNAEEGEPLGERYLIIYRTSNLKRKAEFSPEHPAKHAKMSKTAGSGVPRHTGTLLRPERAFFGPDCDFSGLQARYTCCLGHPGSPGCSFSD